MKIIIVGCGKVGTTLAEQLNRENHDITLIDTDDEALKNISDNVDLMSVTGNGAIYQVQMEAGIQEADLMIATTNSDELNMLCCLIAKKAGNCHTIARIRNPEYSAEIGYIREELNSFWPLTRNWQLREKSQDFCVFRLLLRSSRLLKEGSSC